jgi:hypothetical protein
MYSSDGDLSATPTDQAPAQYLGLSEHQLHIGGFLGDLLPHESQSTRWRHRDLHDLLSPLVVLVLVSLAIVEEIEDGRV